jgi:hypothetical protein
MRKAVDSMSRSADSDDLDRVMTKKELKKIGALMGDDKGQKEKATKEKSVTLEEKDIESML